MVRRKVIDFYFYFFFVFVFVLANCKNIIMFSFVLREPSANKYIFLVFMFFFSISLKKFKNPLRVKWKSCGQSAMKSKKKSSFLVVAITPGL